MKTLSLTEYSRSHAVPTATATLVQNFGLTHLLALRTKKDQARARRRTFFRMIRTRLEEAAANAAALVLHLRRPLRQLLPVPAPALVPVPVRVAARTYGGPRRLRPGHA